MDSPKYAKFNVSTTVYKTVNGQDIDLGVFIPKNVHTGKRPIVIHFHGGFLVTGHALYPGKFKFVDSFKRPRARYAVPSVNDVLILR